MSFASFFERDCAELLQIFVADSHTKQTRRRGHLQPAAFAWSRCCALDDLSLSFLLPLFFCKIAPRPAQM